MCKIFKIAHDSLPAGMDTVVLFKKSTFLLLLLASQCHFLSGSPSFFPGTDAGSGQTSSTNSLSRYDYHSSFDNYRFYHPYDRFPIGPWSSLFGSHGFGHHPRPHQTPIPVHHSQIPDVVSHPSSSGGDTMIRIFLNEHNKVRNSYGAPELAWNPDLVPAAKRVTDTCTFKHTTNNQFGEWVNGPEEKAAYDPNAPRDSHFTQVVWHETREVGCAVTSCTTLAGASLPQSPIQFWACEYNPPGNVETLYTKNVHAAADGAPLKS